MKLVSMMCTLQRGALIVVEGVDRSGKSTQCRKLVESLNAQNIKAQLLNFPDRSTPIGGLIDEYLKNKENQLADEVIHLLFTANRWENKEKMKKLLESGVTLIVDRYSYSGIVYSSVKKNMSVEWCKQPENGLLKPDLVFLLTLPESAIINRPDFGKERYENSDTQTKVARRFLELAHTEDNWEIIEADKTVEEVHKALLEGVLKTMKNVHNAPLRVLDFNYQARGCFA